MKDTSDIPNPNPTQFHGKWTDWSDEHDQKIVNKKGVYLLRMKDKVPQGGKPFFVQCNHPADGDTPRISLDPKDARQYHGSYLLSTCWNWERQFEAVPV